MICMCMLDLDGLHVFVLLDSHGTSVCDIQAYVCYMHGLYTFVSLDLHNVYAFVLLDSHGLHAIYKATSATCMVCIRLSSWTRIICMPLSC